jgi:hypothetical protein
MSQIHHVNVKNISKKSILKHKLYKKYISPSNKIKKTCVVRKHYITIIIHSQQNYKPYSEQKS